MDYWFETGYKRDCKAELHHTKSTIILQMRLKAVFTNFHRQPLSDQSFYLAHLVFQNEC